MAITTERLIATLEARFDKYERALDKALGNTDRKFSAIERRGKQLENRFAAIGGNIGRTFAASLAAGVSLRGAQQLIDSATRIETQLKVAGLEGENLKTVFDQLYASAQRNVAPLETLVTLFGRASLVQQELGVTQQELIGFTDKVALALRVSGTSAEASRGALLQLGQALSTGIVRAEEYNSLQEGATPILRAVAAGLKEAGGSVGKLTNLVKTGQVSSEAFFRAFEAGAITLEQKIEGTELTISQRFVRLQNVLIASAGEFNKSTKAGEIFGDAIDDVSKTIAGIDWDNVITEIENVVGAFNRGVIAAQNFAASLGLDRVGEAFIGAFQNETVSALGTYSTRAVQRRIDEAFAAGAGLDPNGGLTADAIRNRVMSLPDKGVKGGRVGPSQAVKPVSLDDFKLPDDGKSKGGSKSRLDDYEREVRSIQERTAAIRAQTEAMAGINPLVNDYGFALEKAQAKQDLLTAAQRAGIAVTPEVTAAIDDLATSLAQASVDAEKLAEAQDRVRERQEFARDVTRGFIDDLRQGKSAAEALAGALQKVADKLLDEVLDAIFQVNGASGGGGGFLSSLFGGGRGKGGLLGGAIIPGILHSGGTAGKDGYGHGRAVSPSVFAGATRYHQGGIAGLKPGEVPAILQRGELVIPKGGVAASGGGSPSSVFYVTNTFDGNTIQTMIRDGAGRVVQSAAPGIVSQSVAAVGNKLSKNPGYGR